MASLNATRKAIASTLQGLHIPDPALPALTAYAFVTANPALPGVMVARPRITYPPAEGPGVEHVWTLELWLLLARIEDQVNEEQLGYFIDGAGPASIHLALLRSRTVRHDYFGLADTKLRNLRLTTADARFEAAGLDHLGAAYTFDVHLAPAADLPEEG